MEGELFIWFSQNISRTTAPVFGGGGGFFSNPEVWNLQSSAKNSTLGQ